MKFDAKVLIDGNEADGAIKKNATNMMTCFIFNRPSEWAAFAIQVCVACVPLYFHKKNIGASVQRGVKHAFLP